eukprot:4913989-Amphidinium_carterae.1
MFRLSRTRGCNTALTLETFPLFSPIGACRGRDSKCDWCVCKTFLTPACANMVSAGCCSCKHDCSCNALKIMWRKRNTIIKRFDITYAFSTGGAVPKFSATLKSYI